MPSSGSGLVVESVLIPTFDALQSESKLPINQNEKKKKDGLLLQRIRSSPHPHFASMEGNHQGAMGTQKEPGTLVSPWCTLYRGSICGR